MNEVMNATISTNPHETRRLGDVRIIRRVNPRMRSGVSISFAARCQVCHAMAEKSGPVDSPPQFVAQLFRKTDWEISNTCEDITCAKCLESRKIERREKKGIGQAAMPTITPGYIKAMAILHQLLIRHFDKGSRHYDHDWDDARIGAECGLGETHVAHVREVAYGPIVPRTNAQLIELQRELAKVRDVLGKDSTSLHEMVTTFVAEAETRLYELSKAVDQALHPQGSPPLPNNEEKH